MTSAVETPPSNRGRWGPSQGCLMQPNGGRDCWALTAPLWPRARPLTRLHSSWMFTVRTGVSRSRDSILWRKPADKAGWAGSVGEGRLGRLWLGEKWGEVSWEPVGVSGLWPEGPGSSVPSMGRRSTLNWFSPLNCLLHRLQRRNFLLLDVEEAWGPVALAQG